ncbi:tRNA 2-selenouridine(34) synthase MnmH [Hydrogenobacter sp. T-2]|uniref:tRNA 2-selenouridine(34) synthase MnmH n=1 Tax=Pampinifervens diazotrophicum TaxID=1632018 RepID=UPI002B2617D4|nr:tRNA 2-selenouridine(34) synthase MnmH [Hydrogenobacter sp. T-2]WPM32802.1 tRNA 2-selenouridine(34) synthase MnmH [Hydrogenobacter sp. T-2]
MDISPEKIYQLEDKVLVDIRSPSEYQEFHIPGAINLPLFEDEEKRLIGLIYRRDGVDRAKHLGYEIAESKLEGLLKSFRDLKERYRHVVVYCWRGGLRSQELCKVLQSMGVEVLRIEGGYRAYREFILREMERILEGKSFIVLAGKTGVGKTRILRKLKEEGYTVVDLEGLAKDRGSAFGKMGIRERVSQKMFDTLLYESLLRAESDLIFTEDESRAIGNIHLPEAFWRKKEEGVYVEIEASLEKRVKNLLEEYTKFEDWQEEAKESLLRIRRYLGERNYSLALELLSKERVEEFAEFLIREYYDKTYKPHKHPSFRLTCDQIDICLKRLKDIYSCLLKEGITSKPCR